MERKFAQKQKQIDSSSHLINQNDKTTNVEFLTSPWAYSCSDRLSGAYYLKEYGRSYFLKNFSTEPKNGPYGPYDQKDPTLYNLNYSHKTIQVYIWQIKINTCTLLSHS